MKREALTELNIENKTLMKKIFKAGKTKQAMSV
jgi:hypothetical protein